MTCTNVKITEFFFLFFFFQKSNGSMKVACDTLGAMYSAETKAQRANLKTSIMASSQVIVCDGQIGGHVFSWWPDSHLSASLWRDNEVCQM